MDEGTVRVRSLHVHPVKSCAAVDVEEALLVETGFEFDRAWMVVDGAGEFVTQRALPRMALIRPTLKTFEMILRAPGMLALHVALDTVESPVTATVWGTRVAAYDMGDLCARWFSQFLGRELRLVRFDPEQKRLAEAKWTGSLAAETSFQDAFPLLVISAASLETLNQRLVSAGHDGVTMARFRPNIVLDGLDANGEDALDEIAFATLGGPVRIKLVKPCTRCTVPDVDPSTGAAGHAVGDALARYRADPRMDGGITFGMNAIVVDGLERALRVGATGSASHRFD